MLQKHYHTKTSELISEFIQSQNGNIFTASDIINFFEQHNIPVNKTTIYRNLEKWVQAEILAKHKTMITDGFVYQVKKSNCDEHIHFQCSNCGSVIHLENKKTTTYLKSLSSDFNLQIDFSSSLLNGLCPKCKTRK